MPCISLVDIVELILTLSTFALVVLLLVYLPLHYLVWYHMAFRVVPVCSFSIGTSLHYLISAEVIPSISFFGALMFLLSSPNCLPPPTIIMGVL